MQADFPGLSTPTAIKYANFISAAPTNPPFHSSCRRRPFAAGEKADNGSGKAKDRRVKIAG